jgi:hypothetical protein
MAGERTGILNVEGKLGKIMAKDTNTLVVKAADRDTVLSDISARAARYKDLDPAQYDELMALRADVKDVFNNGQVPGEDIMEQLFFLDAKTKDLLVKMTGNYNRIVTPDDFSTIAKIMSNNLASQAPVTKTFTKFFGRLAADFATNAKPKESDISWGDVIRTEILGTRTSGYRLPAAISEMLGMKDEPLSEKFLSSIPGWSPDGILSEMLYGVRAPKYRRTGISILKVEPLQLTKLVDLNLFTPNKLPKNWTNIPNVNFDGKVIEQDFTQTFEERLNYKNADGEWVTNILQIPQKTDPTWWEELINKDGKINDIVDATKAQTAFGVNANHSNDATIVKAFHLWGKATSTPTSSIHDAFFANAADMIPARAALRQIYADKLNSNVIVDTLNEMKSRGFPQELYDQYMKEAIDTGLIPVAGRSIVGGVVLKESDILKVEDVLKTVPKGFSNNYSFYGVG